MLADKIATLVGFQGQLVWDETKPDGQPQRKLEVSRAEGLFGFRSTTDFDAGLRATVDWYVQPLTATGTATG